MLGDLRFAVGVYDPRPWGLVMRASLVGEDGETYLLPVLDRARIDRITASGMLIEGTEVIPQRSTGIKNVKVDRYPQAWWCVPKPPTAQP